MRRILLLNTALLCTFSSLNAQQVKQNYWETDGPVHAVLTNNGKVYLGGEFTYAGPSTGSAGVYNLATSQTVAGMLGITGQVLAVVSDASGNVYLGGSMQVNGGPVKSLIKLNASLSIDPTFSFNFDGPITKLAVNNNSLFAAGSFNFINSQLRPGLAAIDLPGNTLSTFAPNPDGQIKALHAANGNLYVGGGFSFISGNTRSSLAVYNGAKALQPTNPGIAGTVSALCNSDSLLFIAGAFDTIGGINRVNLACLSLNTGTIKSWRADVTGSVTNMAAVSGNLYLAGNFFQVGIASRNHLAAVNILSGAVQSFDPGLDDAVNSIQIRGNVLLAAGKFNSVGFSSKRYLAGISLSTGEVTGDLPEVNAQVNALVVVGNDLYMGGDFSSFGGKLRNNFAVLDQSSGTPLNLSMDVDGPIYDMDFVGTELLVAGNFMSINQELRRGVAIVDTAAFSPTSWDVACDGSINDVEVIGNSIYLAGNFTSFGTSTRNNLAVVNAFSGALGSWDPNMDGGVNQLLLNQTQLYAVGNFMASGSNTRKHVASFDLGANGALRSWNINPDTIVNCIAANGNLIFLGGKFTQLGTSLHSYLAAVDSGSAAPYTFAPITGGEVTSLTELNGLLFAGGQVSTSLGIGLACFNTNSGVEVEFPVKLKSGQVNQSFLIENDLYLSGNFELAGGKRNFAAVTMTTAAPTLQATNLIISQVKPDRMTITFNPGNGSKYLVLANQGSAVDTFPMIGLNYTGSTAFGTGASIGSNFVIGAGQDTTYTVTGLNPGTTYHFAVFAYNGVAAFTTYLTTSPARANQTTTIGYNPPSTAASGINFSNVRLDQMTVRWTKGNGEGRYVIGREATAVNQVPADSTNYFGNAEFGSGDDLGSGNFLVYIGSGDSITVNGLKAGTAYHFSIYEFNGDPILRRVGANAAVGSTSTLSLAVEPTTAASSINITNVTTNSMQLNWTNGNGSGRIVIASKADPVATFPEDGETYFSDNSFNGASSYLSLNERVVYVGSGNGFTLTGLETSTTYHFSVVEYNGTTLTTNYKASGNPTASMSTNSDLIYPTLPSKNIVFTKIGKDTLSMSWTPGNGEKRIVVIRKDSAVNALPVIGTTYAGNSRYGMGDSLGTGTYVVLAGTENTALITGLSPLTTYHVAVFEYNSSPIGSLYLTDSFAFANAQTLPSVGLNKLKRTGAIRTYPNPANNGEVNFLFDRPLPEGARLLVYDLRGQLVFDQTNENKGSVEWHLDLSGWSQGDYLVKVQAGNELLQTRFQLN